MCVLYLCVHLFHLFHPLKWVFGQVGLTIDWNWTSQDRGVFSCTCTFCVCVCVCVLSVVCVCVHVCRVQYKCMCVFVCF